LEICGIVNEYLTKLESWGSTHFDGWGYQISGAAPIRSDCPTHDSKQRRSSDHDLHLEQLLNLVRRDEVDDREIQDYK
jgi:hypothetical protein